MKRLLLDTNVVVWLLLGDRAAVSESARQALTDEHLPCWHHRDPFDRLLVAQAGLESHALVSADSRLAAYGVEVIW